MGNPCGYFLWTSLSKMKVFVEGNLSFVEAPWQPFTRTNRSPQSPFLIVEMVYLREIQRNVRIKIYPGCG